MSVDLQSLHKRVIDRDNVGRNGPIAAFDVSDFQSLIVEAFELRTSSIDRFITGATRDPNSAPIPPRIILEPIIPLPIMPDRIIGHIMFWPMPSCDIPRSAG